MLLGARLGTEFLPQLDEGVIWIRANLPAGISLEKSAAVAGRIRDLIRQSREVKLVMSQSGRNESGTDPFGPNRNEFLLDLQPYSTWPRGKQKSDLVDELSRRLESEIPGASFNFTQPIIDTSTEIATGSSADLAVILSGPDLARLRASRTRPSPSSARCPAPSTRRSSRRPTRRSCRSTSSASRWRATGSTSPTSRT
jgi:cobalt-zinc-cadmium resistance protein CzcA